MRRRTTAVLFGTLLATFVTVALVATGMARTIQLQSSSVIPAAEGKVQLHSGRNQNTEIKLTVKHLAPPERIAPGSSVFVVWVRGLEAGAQAQNLGALRVDRNLNGKLKSTTSLQAFDLFLTCEPNQTITAPTGQELLTLHYTGK